MKLVSAALSTILAGSALALMTQGGAPAAAAVEGPARPVLLELFTSQGCSSCPPADRLAEKLARENGLVVISRPVTYWDRLGWKDTLAREENTRLQRAYASRGLAGENGVYTPQVVVDGRRGTVGSNEAFIRQMITHEASGPAAISAKRLKDGGLAVGLAGEAPAKAELMLIALKRHVTVRIAAGENGNRAINYTNVVVDERPIAEWTGGEQGVRVTPGQVAVPGADAYALVLRGKGAGQVLAAQLVI
jgi:hypothetical protein